MNVSPPVAHAFATEVGRGKLARGGWLLDPSCGEWAVESTGRGCALEGDSPGRLVQGDARELAEEEEAELRGDAGPTSEVFLSPQHLPGLRLSPEVAASPQAEAEEGEGGARPGRRCEGGREEVRRSPAEPEYVEESEAGARGSPSPVGTDWSPSSGARDPPTEGKQAQGRRGEGRVQGQGRGGQRKPVCARRRLVEEVQRRMEQAVGASLNRKELLRQLLADLCQPISTRAKVILAATEGVGSGAEALQGPSSGVVGGPGSPIGDQGALGGEEGELEERGEEEEEEEEGDEEASSQCSALSEPCEHHLLLHLGKEGEDEECEVELALREPNGQRESGGLGAYGLWRGAEELRGGARLDPQAPACMRGSQGSSCAGSRSECGSSSTSSSSSGGQAVAGGGGGGAGKHTGSMDAGQEHEQHLQQHPHHHHQHHHQQNWCPPSAAASCAKDEGKVAEARNSCGGGVGGAPEISAVGTIEVLPPPSARPSNSPPPLWFYQLLADEYAREDGAVAALLPLFSSLWSTEFASQIFALLLHRWLYLCPESNTKDILRFCRASLNGADSLFWIDLGSNERRFLPLFEFIMSQVLLTTSRFAQVPPLFQADLVRLVARFVFLYYPDGGVLRLISSEGLQDVLLGSPVHLIVTELTNQLQRIKVEDVLVQFLRGSEQLRGIELPMITGIRLQVALHSLTTAGGPLFPSRRVRKTARRAVDALFPVGRRFRYIISLCFRLLHPMFWPTSILSYGVTTFYKFLATLRTTMLRLLDAPGSRHFHTE